MGLLLAPRDRCFARPWSAPRFFRQFLVCFLLSDLSLCLLFLLPVFCLYSTFLRLLLYLCVTLFLPLLPFLPVLLLLLLFFLLSLFSCLNLLSPFFLAISAVASGPMLDFLPVLTSHLQDRLGTFRLQQAMHQYSLATCVAIAFTPRHASSPLLTSVFFTVTRALPLHNCVKARYS